MASAQRLQCYAPCFGDLGACHASWVGTSRGGGARPRRILVMSAGAFIHGNSVRSRRGWHPVIRCDGCSDTTAAHEDALACTHRFTPRNGNRLCGPCVTPDPIACSRLPSRCLVLRAVGFRHGIDLRQILSAEIYLKRLRQVSGRTVRAGLPALHRRDRSRVPSSRATCFTASPTLPVPSSPMR